MHYVRKSDLGGLSIDVESMFPLGLFGNSTEGLLHDAVGGEIAVINNH
jgi:hypothetical protein